jgi:hypothetical protein
MADDEIPSDPAEVYKAIIDDCVKYASDTGADRIRAGWPLSPNHPGAPEDLLVNSLSPDQRETLARMLDEARSGGVHDLLARLTWWMEAQELRWTWRGQPVPVDWSGTGLHGDYIGRLATEDRWEWPDPPAKKK